MDFVIKVKTTLKWQEIVNPVNHQASAVWASMKCMCFSVVFGMQILFLCPCYNKNHIISLPEHKRETNEMFLPTFAFEKSLCGRFLIVNLSLPWPYQRNIGIIRRAGRHCICLSVPKDSRIIHWRINGSLQKRMCIKLPSVLPLVSFLPPRDSIPLHSPLFNLLFECKCSLRHCTCY